MKKTKFNLLKEQEKEMDFTDYKPEINDHPYQQLVYKQETFKYKRFLWFVYKVKEDELIIPTGICKVCSLPQIAHYD